MCQIAVNFRFFMPFNFGWKAYFSARGRGVDFYFSARGRGVGLSTQLAYKSSCFFENWGTRGQGMRLLFFCPRPGRGAQRPTCLQKFLLF